jgi:hypothetical protein
MIAVQLAQFPPPGSHDELGTSPSHQTLQTLPQPPPWPGRDFAGIAKNVIVRTEKTMVSARTFRMTNLLRH